MGALVPDTLRAALLEARNPDGGWGYLAGKRSRIEPTSFALVALSEGPAEAGERAKADVFSRFPRRDGLMIDPGATHANLAFNAVAALAAQHPPLGARDTAAALTGVLLQYRGREVPNSTVIVQDNSLIGWPWLDGTFAWVEPTAWCLLALKRWTRGQPRSEDAAGRIDQAERLLKDRMCRGGGWNYGNRLVMDKALRPFASTTALGLLALQDRPGEPVVRTSLQALERLSAREKSGYALALSALAFARLGEPAPEVEAALAALWEETSFGGEMVATALALYVATARESGYEAFGV